MNIEAATLWGRELLASITRSENITLNQVVVSDSVCLRNRAIDGALHFTDCTFEGFVDLEDARFARAVTFRGCKFSGGLSLAHSRFDGPLQIQDSSINLVPGEEKVNFRDLQVKGCIDFECLHVKGDLEMPDLHCEAGLRMRGAVIEGNFNAPSAHIGGDLDFSPCPKTEKKPAVRTEIKKVMDFRQSKIGSEVTLSGGVFGAINFEQSHLGGSLFGTPSSERLRVSITIPTVPSLQLTGARVHGNVQLKKAQLAGGLNMSSAEVRGNLVLSSTCLGASRHRSSLRMVGCEVGAAVVLRNLNISGRIVAIKAKIGILEIDRRTMRFFKQLHAQLNSSEKKDPRKGLIDLKGLSFVDLDIPAPLNPNFWDRVNSFITRTWSHTLAKSNYVALLSLTSFDEGVYCGMERWLRQAGKDDDADSVYLRMRSVEMSLRQGFWKTLRDGILLHLVGFGLMARWLIIIWCLIFLANGLLFFMKSNAVEKKQNPIDAVVSQLDLMERVSVPVSLPVSTVPPPMPADMIFGPPFSPPSIPQLIPVLGNIRTPIASTSKTAAPDVKKANAFDRLYVVFKTEFPMFTLSSENDWIPSTQQIQRIAPIRCRDIANLIVFLNWILVPLIVASLAGLLKKRG